MVLAAAVEKLIYCFLISTIKIIMAMKKNAADAVIFMNQLLKLIILLHIKYYATTVTVESRSIKELGVLISLKRHL
jgi:hypothetical protein